MKTALILLAASLAGCASMKPDNELLMERGYRIKAPKPTIQEFTTPTVLQFLETLSKGGDKNDDGGYGGSGGTGDGGGRSAGQNHRLRSL